MTGKEISRTTLGPFALVTYRILMRVEYCCEGSVVCTHHRESGNGTLAVRTVSRWELDGKPVAGTQTFDLAGDYDK